MRLNTIDLPSKWVIAVSATFMLAWCTSQKNIYWQQWIEQVRYESKDSIAEIISIKTWESILLKDTKNFMSLNDSIRFVWRNEINTFNNFFFWTSEVDSNTFTNKVIELQREFWVNQDGILWPITLRNIYLNHYSKNIGILNSETKKRLEIYQDMLWYKNRKWALYSKLNTFNLESYYGKNMWLNIPWTYINEKLVWVFPENLSRKEKLITFKNVDGKSALAFYIDGKLELATFSSPWRTSGRAFTPKLNTNWQRNPSKLHFSSSYPKTDTNEWWAVMPYAVHIDWPIWIHGSDGRIDWTPASAWCIRVWLYYMEYLHSRVNQLWIRNVRIDTRNIY